MEVWITTRMCAPGNDDEQEGHVHPAEQIKLLHEYPRLSDNTKPTKPIKYSVKLTKR